MITIKPENFIWRNLSTIYILFFITCMHVPFFDYYISFIQLVFILISFSVYNLLLCITFAIFQRLSKLSFCSGPTYWNIVHNILTPGLFEDLINHLQHYKLWGGAVSSLQSMLCCINREWLAAPAKNYIVLSVESDSANFFENFKDTLYLIIFFPFVLLQISLLLKFWIPGTLYSLPKKENILILGERNCSIVFCFLPTMIRIYFLV